MGHRSHKSKKSKKKRHRILHFQRKTAPGAVPGTVAAHPDAPSPVIQVTRFDGESLEVIPVNHASELRRMREGRRGVLWVNVDGLGDAEVIKTIGDVFGLHRLAMEDVVNTHQRPKVEPYQDHLFIVLRMTSTPGRADLEQVSLFFGKDFVITFQERKGDCFDPVRARLQTGRGRIRTAGADYLAYCLADAVVDAFFPHLEYFGDKLEELEADVMDARDLQTLVRRIHDIKRELLGVRRAVWPLREALGSLIREESDLIHAETRIYLRDCYDHAVQLMDMTETYRELASGLMDLHISTVGQRTNDVMKVLTIFAAIFIPLTFIAGLYGMNFDVMPELHWTYGYPFALGVMVVTAIVLLYYFYRRGWLGEAQPRSTAPGVHGSDRNKSGQPGAGESA